MYSESKICDKKAQNIQEQSVKRIIIIIQYIQLLAPQTQLADPCLRNTVLQ